jgi:hypothetical protein
MEFQSCCLRQHGRSDTRHPGEGRGPVTLAFAFGRREKSLGPGLRRGDESDIAWVLLRSGALTLRAVETHTWQVSRSTLEPMTWALKNSQHDNVDRGAFTRDRQR